MTGYAHSIVSRACAIRTSKIHVSCAQNLP
jgi:hypothetical protein